MVKQRRLKYFSVEGDVWCPTKDDFLLADVSKKDLPDIQDAYGKFVGFPTHDKFIQFIKVFFKLKTFKSAEVEFKNIKPIFIGNPFSKKPCEGSGLLLNACLIYLSLLKPKQETPLFVQQVLIDMFPLDNLSGLKSFLESNFSSCFTLDQQVITLLWLQPILENKDSVVLGPKKSFPSCSSSATTIQKHQYVTMWLKTLSSAMEKSTTPFSGFLVKVNTTKTGKLVGIGTLNLRFDGQVCRVSVRLDHQSVHILGLISHNEWNNIGGYKRIKMSLDEIQSYSEQYGLIQSPLLKIYW